MLRLLIIALLAFAAWKAYGEYQSRKAHAAPQGLSHVLSEPGASPGRIPETMSQFRCDGRTHCSQMTSCAEATFFIKNCPGTKMDGNNDGIPCEQQWCKP
jgi:hypothetical protein